MKKRWNFYTAKEIRADGWLLSQLKIQAQGLSGNLDKVWPDVRDSAWIGGDREGWERVPYWLDGFVPLAYLLEDEDMIARAKRYMDAILASQRPDGWICPCTEEEIPEYDSWAVQLITKVLTVYYECSGDERIPDALYRVLKNYFELLKSGRIHLFAWGKFRWYETFIAISFIYERKPEPWLLELAAILKEQGVCYSDFKELWKTPLYCVRLETHIVGIAMMLKWEALCADLLGDEYKDVAEEYHRILSDFNGMPTGTFTGDEHLAGLSPIQGTELCAVVEQMYSYEHLFAKTGDTKWAERLEELAFNALPATISENMWAHQYDQQSNQIACVTFPGKPIFSTNRGNAHLFGLEPNYGCCTANFNQAWPKLSLFSFLHREDEIISAVLLPSRLNSEEAEVCLETDYPFNTSAKYSIKAKKDLTFRLRIPAFAENPTVNGEATEEKELAFRLKAGEEKEIRLQFEATPYFKDRPHGLKTVQWGSLIFSLPIEFEEKRLEYEKDGVERKFPYCDYELYPKSPWNFAFSDLELRLDKKKLGSVPFSFSEPPVVIHAKMKRIDWGLETGYQWVCAKTPHSLEPQSDETEVALYPYGCAKLRMTEMPLLKK